eukprot:g5237.t1
MPKVVNHSFDFTSADGNVVNSFDFLNNKSLSPKSSKTLHKNNIPAQTIDLAFDLSKSIHDRRGKQYKKKQGGSGLTFKIKKSKKKRNKFSTVDLSFSSSAKNADLNTEFERPEDDSPAIIKYSANTVEGKAKQVLLDAFDAVNKEFEDGADWASSKWNKEVLSPNSYLSPYKDFYTPVERIKIEREKKKIRSLPIPKLRYKKNRRLLKNSNKYDDTTSNNTNSNPSGKHDGEYNFLNVRECRGKFQDYLNKAMKATEYLEKKKALFRPPKRSRKKEVVESKFKLTQGKEKTLDFGMKTISIFEQGVSQPYQNEMHVLQDKGILSFIKEALRNNKSALSSGYKMEQLLFPGKSNSWKKANHIQSFQIGNELGNVGRQAINGRRFHKYKKLKSDRRMNNLINHSNPYNVRMMNPYKEAQDSMSNGMGRKNKNGGFRNNIYKQKNSAVKLYSINKSTNIGGKSKGYYSPRPPQKLSQKKNYTRNKRSPRSEKNQPQNKQQADYAFQGNVTLDQYFASPKLKQ